MCGRRAGAPCGRVDGHVRSALGERSAAAHPAPPRVCCGQMVAPDTHSRDARFAALGRVASTPVAAALTELVERGTDAELCRINVLDFAAQRGLPDDRVIDGFVHASKLGLFDLSWSLLCPACGGVLDARTSVRDVADCYHCALCCAAYQPKLDEMVEVSFTVNPSVRRIAAHDPDALDPVEYFRLLHWSQGL